jgi:DNA helicase-2/ATP-dependent DNA helicase PcrA
MHVTKTVLHKEMEERMALWSRSFENLNEGQKKAVETIEGPVVVMAGPGTGKTQVLTLRIANILRSTDVPPDAILALTFTNSGVSAMRERLKRFIGNDAYKVHIFTFHGYASAVIDAHPDRFPRVIGAAPADDIDRFTIIRDAILKPGMELLRPSGNPEYYIRPILKLIGALKSDRVLPQTYRDYITSGEDEAAQDKEGEPSTKLLRSEAFVEVYEAYERGLRERGLYDYVDMLLELILALEHDTDLRLELAESAQYILADEHQDANAAQNRILELLASAHPDNQPNLFIVGDDKQAIYRFQGASLENFLYFKKRYPSAVVIPLTQNYRSKKEVLTSAYALMQGHSVEDIELIAEQGEGGAVECIVAPREEDEIATIALRIKALLGEGAEPREVAVLVRKNKDIDAFARQLRALSVPYVSFRDADALESSAVLLLIALVRAAVDPYDEGALGKALFLPSFHLTAATLATVFRMHGKPLLERLPRDGKEGTARTFFESFMKRAHTMNAIEALDLLVAESGFVSEVMEAQDLTHALEAYRSIRTLIESRAERPKGFTLQGVVALLTDLERGVASLPVQREHEGGGVRLMSLHRSKGLEFAHVFLPHALESKFKPRADRALFLVPPYVSQPDASLDDERRLFYVGVTRAKERVYISRHEKRSDDKEEAPLNFVSELTIPELQVPPPTVSPIIPTMATQSERTKEYRTFVEAFFESGISATALNNYLRDPWECFIKSIIRIPQSKEAHQMYGSAIHKALERFHTALKEDTSPDAAFLVAAFNTALTRAPLSDVDRAAYGERGTDALKAYAEAYAGTFATDVETEVEVHAELLLPEGASRERVLLHGFLDKIENLKDGGVRVVDYKTGSPKSRNHIEGKTKDSDGDYKRQLVFYRLLLDREGKRTLREAVLDFVEANDRGIHKREAFVITEEEVQALEAEIVRMLEDLDTGAFLQKTSASEDAEVRALAALLQARFVGRA